MGKNSIQSNLTKDDLIAEIRLTLGADFKREHTVIIVEGEDDISFFYGKLSSNVDIRESFPESVVFWRSSVFSRTAESLAYAMLTMIRVPLLRKYCITIIRAWK